MNSYTSLTDAPPRSTPRLLKETQLSCGVPGLPVPARAAGPARTAAAAARLRRAFSGSPAPSSPSRSRLSRVPVPPRRSDVTSRSPYGLPLHGTQVNNSLFSLAIDSVLSGEDPIRIRSPEGQGHPTCPHPASRPPAARAGQTALFQHPLDAPGVLAPREHRCSFAPARGPPRGFAKRSRGGPPRNRHAHGVVEHHSPQPEPPHPPHAQP